MPILSPGLTSRRPAASGSDPASPFKRELFPAPLGPSTTIFMRFSTTRSHPDKTGGAPGAYPTAAASSAMRCSVSHGSAGGSLRLLRRPRRVSGASTSSMRSSAFWMDLAWAAFVAFAPNFVTKPSMRFRSRCWRLAARVCPSAQASRFATNSL